jgi:hypothetical protein
MKLPKRLKGKQSPSHARSPRQEKEIAKRIGGRVTRGSGCGNEKGDVRVKGVVRLEAKTTMAKSFSVTLEMIGKIEDAAVCSGELPVLVVEFLNPEGKPVASATVMPSWALDILLSKQTTTP